MNLRLTSAAVLIAVFVSTAAGCSSTSQSDKPSPTADAAPVSARPVPAAQLAGLPEATTATSLASAPIDGGVSPTDGTVVHNTEVMPVFTEPGGAAFAKLPTKQVGNDTWLPVVESQAGWLRVLLPSRPNSSSGWIEDKHVDRRHTGYTVDVVLADKSIRLYRDKHLLGTWKAAIGAPDTPTPTGRTFLLASIKDPSQSFSPVILPLGTHSSTLDTYGGGPGTVAIHTWPTDVYGQAVSHGCVRVPADALHAMQMVPLGSIVTIS